jgi:hypothetical protein
MPRYLIKLTDPDNPWDWRVMEWSTVVDAPVTYGLTVAEAERLHEVDPRYSDCVFHERLYRMHTKGHSNMVFDPEGPDARVACNRAGPDEESLDRRQIWKRYVVERPPGAIRC